MPEPFRIAVIGECLIELQDRDGAIAMAFGGDTFTTAAYMARLGETLGLTVDYVSALGDDPYSAAMTAFWRAHGVGDGLVPRHEGKRPGLSLVRTDAAGQRHSYEWRGEAAVRDCFETDGADEVLAALGSFAAIHLSGISLAVLRPASRARLLARLDELAGQGRTISFETAYRPDLWENVETARALYEALFAIAGVVLATAADLEALGLAGGRDSFGRYPDLEVVIDDGTAPRAVIAGDRLSLLPAVTGAAAGAGFNAAYLLGRLLRLEPAEAARRAREVGAAAARHGGDLMPREAMPSVFADLAATAG